MQPKKFLNGLCFFFFLVFFGVIAVFVSNKILAQTSDTTPPTITLTAPDSGATLSGNVTVSATASDNVGINYVMFYVDGVVRGTGGNFSPYSFTWYTAGDTDGPHALYAEAHDKSNNITATQSITVAIKNSIVDTMPPTVTLTASTSGATLNGNVTVSATVTDNVGVNYAILYVDGKINGGCNSMGGFLYNCVWVTTDYADGSHAVYVKAYDKSQNSADSPTITVSVKNTDTTPPTVTLTAPDSGATLSGNVTVSATASDNVGINYVMFYVDGVVRGTGGNFSPYSFTWYTAGDTDGPHALYAEAHDKSNNITATQSITVTVNNTSMAVACAGYTYNAWSACVGGTQTRTIAASTPSGCLMTASGSAVPEALSRTCDSTVACAGYTYSEWSACVGGTQTRSIKASTPSGCLMTASGSAVPEVLSRTCVSNTAVCTAYTYGNWSACDITGTQKQTIATRIPAGCTLPSGVSEIKTQACAYQVFCTYTYGSWTTTCDSSGFRSRPYTAAPVGCSQTTAPYISESCNAVACSSYTYSDWSVCASSGTQTRTIQNKLPAGCTGMSSAALSQVCTYSMPCTSYTYDAWSACSSDGAQIRSIVGKSPVGCVDSASVALSAILKQACAILPCASYIYSDWSECNESGVQNRRILTKEPAGCVDVAIQELNRSCNYLPCKSYAYSEWSDCDSAAKQSRKVILSAPAGCSGGAAPELKRDCVVSEEKPCIYSYGAWGACVAGRQNRMVVTKSSVGCDESAAPELTGDCVVAQSILSPTLIDAPVPVPESMLVSAPEIVSPEVVVPANLNGRTDSSWQKYYFGSADCQSAVICAGSADPDNDGLNNNDEYRFGTNPKSSDTDLDGLVDGYEILNGHNPLVAETSATTDAVVYESPKEAGQELGGTYQVDNVVYDATKKELTISGRALPDSYVTVYIYSDPVVLTVKTDADGNWSYVLDKPMEDGSHEVYVAVNDNAGKVIAKSAPLAFVQTAEAATVTYPAAAKEKAPAPTKTRLWEGYLIFFGIAAVGLLLALAAIGLGRKISNAKNG